MALVDILITVTAVHSDRFRKRTSYVRGMPGRHTALVQKCNLCSMSTGALYAPSI